MTDAPDGDPRFDDWIEALSARHFADLTFAEVSRALRALSSAYVERRARLSAGVALTGAGKRAAFALFYAPLHFLLVRSIVRALPGAGECPSVIVDLGCGTGAAGAAWAVSCRRMPDVVGVDRNGWALDEARLTYREFGVRARLVQADLLQAPIPSGPAAIVAAFAMNELENGARDTLMSRLLAPSRSTHRVLVVEPIAHNAAPWWEKWRRKVIEAGGRADEWRLPLERPPIIEKFDRAAGLDHRDLTGRSLYFTSPTRRPPTRADAGAATY